MSKVPLCGDKYNKHYTFELLPVSVNILVNMSIHAALDNKIPMPESNLEPFLYPQHMRP